MKCTSERRARKREIFSETENERKTVGWLVDWCFEPSQPHRAISGLRERQGRERERDRDRDRDTDRQTDRDRDTEETETGTVRGYVHSSIDQMHI